MMKRFVKRAARRVGGLAGRLARASASPFERKRRDDPWAFDRTTQVLLAQKYREAAHLGLPLPSFREAEFRAFSQYGEDGILLLIFSVIGAASRRAVEICAGNGVECNAANLVVNHGWEALLCDGDPAQVAEGAAFYRECPETRLLPPRQVAAWVTAENVNALVAENGFGGEIDLLSLDMDGVDYWVWKALDAASPRVVVLEYNNSWGPDDAVTVPYRPDFRDDGSGARGASLAAFVKLGREKGYRLAGCHRYGFNAFFLRAGLGEAFFPEVSAASCLAEPFARLCRQSRPPGPPGEGWMRG